MKAGDIVEIYDDPLTRRHSQGLGKLIRKLHVIYEGETEYWKVRFLQTGKVADRTIYVVERKQDEGNRISKIVP